MNWNDPAERLSLIDSVGIDEYNRRIEQHFNGCTLETVGGHDIRTVDTRFGRLFQVGKTGTACATLEAARQYATDSPSTRPKGQACKR